MTTDLIDKNQTFSAEQQKLMALVEKILAEAKKKGATAAEVSATIDLGFSATVRMGQVDTVEHHRDKGIGITVFLGNRRGSVSTSDISEQSITESLEKACSIAKYTGDDPFAGLADKEMMAFNYPDLDLYHHWDIDPHQAVEMATACEDKARGLSKLITNSDGASVSTHDYIYVYGNSHGFVGGYPRSRHNISLVLIGQQGDSMQRDYSYSVAHDPLDLEPINKIAEEAVTRTTRRLNGRRLSTRKVPVIFAAEIASGLIGSFIAAIRGSNLYRKSSFLLDSLGKPIFPAHINLTELPHIKKGLASAPFDDEGVMTSDRELVKDGILQGYVLSSYSARKLGMQTTGNAGGIHNLIINTDSMDLPELLRKMDTGLLVTEVMGQGVNILTGDYSRGASGFWVENGTIQYPVEEITIAGNLNNMLANIVTVANDIDYRSGIQTGSILLEEMMVAGE